MLTYHRIASYLCHVSSIGGMFYSGFHNFCLYLLNRMRRDLIKIRSCAIFSRLTGFIQEIKTKGYDVIGVNVFLRKLMRFLRKNPEYYIPPILLMFDFFSY